MDIKQTPVAGTRGEKSVGPFTMVSGDGFRKLGSDTYRVVLYGAYNAGGLIGPEKNGIAVLCEERMAVVCDEIEIADSGYFGPSASQIVAFNQMLSCSDKEFRLRVNTTARNRFEI